MKKTFSNVSLTDLTGVANYIASLRKDFNIFTFHGQMGAGKTTLIGKIVCAVIGKEIEVTSPTFALVNVYEGAEKIYHFDCYRIEKTEDAINAGIEEMLYGNAVCLVEWPEKIGSLLPQKIVTVTLSTPDDESYRYIEINIPEHD